MHKWQLTLLHKFSIAQNIQYCAKLWGGPPRLCWPCEVMTDELPEFAWEAVCLAVSSGDVLIPRMVEVPRVLIHLLSHTFCGCVCIKYKRAGGSGLWGLWPHWERTSLSIVREVCLHAKTWLYGFSCPPSITTWVRNVTIN